MRVHSECQFPHFRERFWSSAGWAAVNEAGEAVLLEPESVMEAAVTRPAARQHRLGLKALDLRSLPRDEGPPSELQIRREKFAYFDKICSEVSKGLFLGSESVAKSREILQKSNITHIVNCVGFIYPEYFKNEISYKTLRLQDTPTEDLTSILYDVFDFMEAARQSGGNVFVHCSQGVSRSATIVIGYLMWKLDQPYEEVFAAVKAIRGVANPNIGFTCQLLQWHKRRKTENFCRVYRIGPHSTSDPLFLVPKLLGRSTPSALDPRGAFVVHTPRMLYVWRGSRCPPAMEAAAEHAAQHLAHYENAAWPPQYLREGEDSPRESEFWKVLQEGDQISEAHTLTEVESYTKDFETYFHAAIASTDPLHRAAMIAAPSPRAAVAQAHAQIGPFALPASPNDRAKKYRRSEGGQEPDSSGYQEPRVQRTLLMDDQLGGPSPGPTVRPSRLGLQSFESHEASSSGG